MHSFAHQEHWTCQTEFIFPKALFHAPTRALVFNMFKEKSLFQNTDQTIKCSRDSVFRTADIFQKPRDSQHDEFYKCDRPTWNLTPLSYKQIHCAAISNLNLVHLFVETVLLISQRLLLYSLCGCSLPVCLTEFVMSHNGDIIKPRRLRLPGLWGIHVDTMRIAIDISVRRLLHVAASLRLDDCLQQSEKKKILYKAQETFSLTNS
jgi:hypothetical protein